MNRSRVRILIVCASCVLLLGTSSPPVSDWPRWAKVPPDLDTEWVDEDALVVLDSREIVVKNGHRTGRRRWVVKVLTEAGAEHAILALARGSFDRFSKVKVWVKSRGGGVSRYGEDEGSLWSVAERKELDETEVLLLAPPRVTAGTAMAVQYDFSSTPDIPQDLFPIQTAIPASRVSVTIKVRGEWKVVARVGSGINPGPREVTGDGSWEFRDVPSRASNVKLWQPLPPRTVLALDYVPPGGDSVFRSWQTTAHWALGLFARRGDDDRLIEATLDDLRSNAGDADIVDQIGSRVRRLRYFAIEIGWGGLVPRPPETTLSRSFGDCKDKSHLMVELLRREGVESMPLLTSAPSDAFIQEALPGPRQFNHCVVAIPWGAERVRRPDMVIVESPDLGPIRIFDPTLSDAATRDIDFRLEGAQGLAVNPLTRELIAIPRSSAGENAIEETFRWSFDHELRLTGELTRRYYGASRMLLEDDDGERLDRSELRSGVFPVLSRQLPGFTDLEVGEIVVATDGHWSYGGTFRHPAALSEFQHLLVFYLPPVVEDLEFPVPEADEPEIYLPLKVAFRRRDEIRLPPGMTMRLPETLELSNSLARIEMKARRDDDGHVLIEREVNLVAHEITLEMSDDARAVRRALRRLNRVALVLEPTPPPESAAISKTTETASGSPGCSPLSRRLVSIQ